MCELFIIVHSLCDANHEENRRAIDGDIQHCKSLIVFKSLKQEKNTKKKKKKEKKPKIVIKQR